MLDLSSTRCLPTRVVVVKDDRLVLLTTEEIQFTETVHHELWVASDHGRFRAANYGLQAIQRVERRLTLSAGFFRVHHRFLVNLSRVREIEPGLDGTLLLIIDPRNSKKVPVARDYTFQVRQALGLWSLPK